MPEKHLQLPTLPPKFVIHDNLNALQLWVLAALQDFKTLTTQHPHVDCHEMSDARFTKVSADLKTHHHHLSTSLQQPSTAKLLTDIQTHWEGFILNLQRLGPIETISQYIATHHIHTCQAIVVIREKQKNGLRARWSRAPKLKHIPQLQSRRQLPEIPAEAKKRKGLGNLLVAVRKRWSRGRPLSSIATEDGNKRLSQLEREAEGIDTPTQQH